MTFIPIKKIQKHDPATGEPQEKYAVPSVAIATQQGRKLIPNPAGNEASLFDTLEEAEDAIRRAGFDYEFEGKRTYTLSQQPSTKTTSRASGQSPLEQAVPLLMKHLQDREAAVVSHAAYALGALKAYAALEPLVEILGHDDPTVRKNVAEAMARLGAAALPRLRDAFEQARTSNHKHAPYIRLTVLNAFLEMLEQGIGTALSEQFLSLAVSALEDDSWLVRSQAALVVGRTAQAIEDEKKRLAQQRTVLP
jgi:HEAT repeat protein